jgi:hypothetical protein
MKRIIKNFIIRDSSELVEGTGKYETIKFTPSIEGQVLFESLSPEVITQVEKTELFINGIRYVGNNDYKIINGITLKWLNPYKLKITDKLVFIYR